MARKVVMPSFGMYTAEGILAAWRRPSGAQVEIGEVVLEIETEKAVEEVEAPASGVLHHVLREGAHLQVESLIGYILDPGETPPAPPTMLSAITSAASAAPAAPAAIAATGAAAAHSALDEVDFEVEVRASPIAKRLAREHGLDIERLTGTGPNGRIVESDVRAVLTGVAESNVVSESSSAQRVPLSRLRRNIGERLRRTLETAVSLTLTREVRAESLVAARAGAATTVGHPVPYDALFVKLLADALQQFPYLNATIEGRDLVVFSHINIAVAVAVEGGLLAPVIHAAESMSLRDVAIAIRELRKKAMAGRLAPGDMAGGTATLTNLGAYGIDAFTPVLNPPQAIVLGIGRIQPRPVVDGSTVVPGRTVVLSLTFDHRVTDGVPAARFLDAIARLMSDETHMAGWS